MWQVIFTVMNPDYPEVPKRTMMMDMEGDDMFDVDEFRRLLREQGIPISDANVKILSIRRIPKNP